MSRKPTVDVTKFAVPVEPTSEEDEDEDYEEAAAAASSVSSYAGSAQSVNDGPSADATNLAFTELSNLLAQAFDPTPLDRAIAMQAQSSGMLHAKSREVNAMQQEAVRRLQEVKNQFSKDLKVARNLISDLEWTQKRLNTLVKTVKRTYPIEYIKASERWRGEE